MPIWKFAGTEAAGESTAFWDVPLDLDVEDGPHLDIPMDLDVCALLWSNVPLDLDVLASSFFDIGLDLDVVEGLLLSDLQLDCHVTDGNHFRDVCLDLAVIAPIPTFRSVVAQRLASVIVSV